MSIDTFTKQDFESVLPEETQHLGLVSNEYCYLLPVTENAGILIRSSISSLGYSDAVGEDSIRVYPTLIEILYHVHKAKRCMLIICKDILSIVESPDKWGGKIDCNIPSKNFPE